MDYNLAIEIAKDIISVPNCEVLLSGEKTAYIMPKTEEYLIRMTKVVQYKTTIIKSLDEIQEDILKVSVCDLSGIANSEKYFADKWSDKAAAAISIIAGLIVGLIIGIVTEIYTSGDYNSVKKIAEQSETGAATTIISGLAVGMLSTGIPIILICVGIRMIKEAGADQTVLQLKSLEAFAKAADGKATKIIIPSEIQSLAGLVTSVTEIAKKSETEN